ncbi:MAG: TorF family putative porin [Puniceicoccaceae bacterium]
MKSVSPLLLPLCVLPAVLCAGGPDLGNLSLSAMVGFESEYVYRGEKRSGAALQPSLEAGHPLGPGDAFAGVWANQNLGGEPEDEVDFYAGYAVPLSPVFALGAGFTYYWHPDEGAAPDREKETFLGIFADLPLRPSLNGYYNFTFDQAILEVGLAHTFALTDRASLVWSATLGTGRAGDADSDQVPGDPENGFWYGDTSVDWQYAVNEVAAVSLGLRYSGREDGGFRDHLVWGAAVEMGF